MLRLIMPIILLICLALLSPTPSGRVKDEKDAPNAAETGDTDLDQM